MIYVVICLVSRIIDFQAKAVLRTLGFAKKTATSL